MSSDEGANLGFPVGTAAEGSETLYGLIPSLSLARFSRSLERARRCMAHIPMRNKRKQTPPTTPPAIAPAETCLLAFPGSAAEPGVRLPGSAAEDDVGLPGEEPSVGEEVPADVPDGVDVDPVDIVPIPAAVVAPELLESEPDVGLPELEGGLPVLGVPWLLVVCFEVDVFVVDDDLLEVELAVSISRSSWPANVTLFELLVSQTLTL